MEGEALSYAKGGHFTQSTGPQQPTQIECVRLNGSKTKNGRS